MSLLRLTQQHRIASNGIYSLNDHFLVYFLFQAILKPLNSHVQKKKTSIVDGYLRQAKEPC